LAEYYLGSLTGDLYVEEVLNFPLVFHLPSLLEISGESVVEGVLVIMGIQGEQVIYVTAEEENLLARARGCGNCLTLHEDTSVFLRGGETVAFEPGEDRALPAAASLCHAVDGFLYAEHRGLPLDVHLMARGGGAVDYFVV